MIRGRKRIFLCSALLLAAVALTGCAGQPISSDSAHLEDAGEAGRCAQYFFQLDKITAATGSFDGGYSRIEGYPYLRVNRLLASFRGEVSDSRRFNSWLGHLQELEHEARALEIRNLPAASWRERLPGLDRIGLLRRAHDCGEVLKALDFKLPAQRELLTAQAFVADEYHWLPRIMGLYPLSSLLVSQGVRVWHGDARKAFSTGPPVDWSSRRYVRLGSAASQADVRVVLQQAAHDALGFPAYSKSDLSVLFGYYAPVWEVRQQSDDDRIGAPYWRYPGQPAVQIQRPVTYTHLSFTRYQGELLTQLNYIIWFPARTRQHWLDIYAGPLDGVNLRITLNASGEPLLYETMHNCGCYYKAYPTRHLQTLANIDYPEPPLILSAPVLDTATQSLTVAMQSASHYVEHLYPSTRHTQVQSIPYALHDYSELLSLADGAGGRASLFNADGNVPASDRPERYLLWPTGVSSPGAMRQWGRHAVAFVGERHFDDPDAMQKMFTPAVPR